MNVVEIADSSSGSVARIAVDQGFNCFSFVARLNSGESVSVIEAPEGFENGGTPIGHNGIPILFPFPNRIRGGRYSWDGRDYHLPPSLVPYDGTGNAIHGLCIDCPWRVVEQSPESVTGEFQLSIDAPERLALWPADAILQLRYSVVGTTLRAEITVINPDSVPLPWGFGTHAYFSVPLSVRSQPAHCTVYAPVHKEWVLQDCLPDGRQTLPAEDASLADSPYFDTLKVDNVFTDIEVTGGVSVCRIVDEQAGLQLEQRSSADFRELVAFTPPWSSSICLEPYTCVTDAINLQQRGISAGWQVLAPGAEWHGQIDLEVRPLVC